MRECVIKLSKAHTKKMLEKEEIVNHHIQESPVRKSIPIRLPKYAHRNLDDQENMGCFQIVKVKAASQEYCSQQRLPQRADMESLCLPRNAAQSSLSGDKEL